MAIRLGLVISLLFLISQGACGDGTGINTTKCIAGASVECACPAGLRGTQLCNAKGALDACKCPVPGEADAAPDSRTVLPGLTTDAAPDAPTVAPGVTTDAAPDEPTPGIVVDVAVAPDTATGDASGTATGGAGGSRPDATGPGGTGGSSMGGTDGGAGRDGSSGGSRIPDAPVPNTPIDYLRCGNGVADPGEACDDGNNTAGDGCAATCQVEEGWSCPVMGKPCIYSVKCGDRLLSSTETCDDGNTVDGDGCSADCSTIEPGWQCRTPGKPCNPRCGDGKIIAPETCDDGNTNGWDGCSSVCQTEPGATCLLPGQACAFSICGNGKVEPGELCDLGIRNGLFFGDGKGCSQTCTKEPACRDSSGRTQACTVSCGDGNLSPGEECDDGNMVDGDGCSSSCKAEPGFSCTTKIFQNTSTCASGSGQCLKWPITYRDFQPLNAGSGGHPDFYFLGAKDSDGSVATWCVPNSAGPALGNDSTARCWDIAAPDLLDGRPQYNADRASNLCPCQFSDWSIANGNRIAGGYTAAGNDSPLTDGNGGYRSDVTAYTPTTPGGPIWKGMVPIVQDANSFKQWFVDDSKVNKTFTGVLELQSIATNIYQYASWPHLKDGGFFPLDTINASQKTQCNLFPYWKRGDGSPRWPTCSGDQYLFPPLVVQSDCPNQNPLSNGCWVTNLTGAIHNYYFTSEARFQFVYDGNTGLTIQSYGDHDLFVFINGKLVLDLGGVHQALPGKVTVTGDPGVADITEGGCLDAAGNITGAAVGSRACLPSSTATAPAATTPDDFRIRKVELGLNTGKTYEVAIFAADRHPPESNFRLMVSGSVSRRSLCTPRCGDGVVSIGEDCDAGDQNSDTAYGGCTTKCKFGPYCGDGFVDASEQCDQGKSNGSASLGPQGCSVRCTLPHFCGDGMVDPGEACDLGSANGRSGQVCSSTCKYLAPSVDTGTGGKTGSTDASASGKFEPMCASLSTIEGIAPTKGAICTSNDPQLCYKTCGPESIGFKSETCTGGSYVEQSSCSFPTEGNYACYKIPVTVDSTCTGGATIPPQASTPCTTAPCTLCNLNGAYLDSTGAAKSGYCVCPASSMGNSKWSCAPSTAWPCPAGQGC